MNKNYYAILMAGGVGSRFWPVSTEAFPKPVSYTHLDVYKRQITES